MSMTDIQHEYDQAVMRAVTTGNFIEVSNRVHLRLVEQGVTTDDLTEAAFKLLFITEAEASNPTEED